MAINSKTDRSPPTGAPWELTSSDWNTLWDQVQMARAQASGAYGPVADLATVLSTGSIISRTLADRFGDVVNVLDFGADPSGVADSTAAVEAAFAALPAAGGKMLFPPGAYSVGDVDVSGKPVAVSGYGAVITCTGASGAFYKTDHGPKLTVEGIAFIGSGTGRAISHNSAASGSVYDEILIRDCQFTMGSGVFGVYLVGSREPRIHSCTFFNSSDGSGLYLKDAVSPFVENCIFRGNTYAGHGVYYPGTGNGTDAGLLLRDCEIMGWAQGVEVVACDWLVISGCTIDYCTQSIKLGSQDRAQISENYIGSMNANPALWLTSDPAGVDPAYTEKVTIINNTFTGHYDAADTYDCILIDGSPPTDGTIIAFNNITFYTRYGINFDVTGSLVIFGNKFNERTGRGVAPVYNASGTGDSSVQIRNNTFANTCTLADTNVAFARVSENIGCSTEASGVATAGTGVSTVNVAHGLAYTPQAKDVVISATNAEAAARNPYFGGADATNIVVNFTAVTTANAGIAWRARRAA